MTTAFTQYILVIQWFRVVCRISHASLKVCVYTRKYKGQVGYSKVNHEKSLYNYFIPCHRKFRRESLAGDVLHGNVGWYTAEYTTAFLHSDWLYFLWRAIKKYNMDTLVLIFRSHVEIRMSRWIIPVTSFELITRPYTR